MTRWQSGCQRPGASFTVDLGEVCLLRGVEMAFPCSVAWAPDGLSLLFTGKPSPRGSRTELWRVPVQGGEPRKLDLTAAHIRDLRLHPDGRHIAYTAGKDRLEVWALSNFLPAAEAPFAAPPPTSYSPQTKAA